MYAHTRSSRPRSISRYTRTGGPRLPLAPAPLPLLLLLLLLVLLLLPAADVAFVVPLLLLVLGWLSAA
jgi:hypothetical protein